MTTWPLPQWPAALLAALLILVGGGLLSMLLARVTGVVLRRLTARTRSTTDDLIAQMLVSTMAPLGWVVSAVLAWRALPLAFDSEWAVLGLAKLAVTVLLVRLVNGIAVRLLQGWGRRIDDPAIGSMVQSLAPMVRALVWSVGAVLYLQNIGVQMAAIWALLSAGGIGAGLALKEPVQEFFEYITILLDKPFQNGDFIHVDGIWGHVERVGVRSTRLRSINGEAIVMSNSALTGAVVSNYAQMGQRRLLHTLGVVYDTSPETLERIPAMLQAIVTANGDAIFDRCHFVAFGSSSLDFELSYFIPTNDYVQALDAQQRINLEIARRFAANGIEFAFPTRTVQMVQAAC